MTRHHDRQRAFEPCDVEFALQAISRAQVVGRTPRGRRQAVDQPQALLRQGQRREGRCAVGRRQVGVRAIVQSDRSSGIRLRLDQGSAIRQFGMGEQGAQWQRHAQARADAGQQLRRVQGVSAHFEEIRPPVRYRNGQHFGPQRGLSLIHI